MYIIAYMSTRVNRKMICIILCRNELKQQGGNTMKQINISVSFDDEKLRALNKYLKKKELTAEDELAAALLHLYEKHVPAAVREYIDEDDVVVPAKPKRTAKQTVPKKVEEPVPTAPVITDGGEESLASKYFGTT